MQPIKNVVFAAVTDFNFNALPHASADSAKVQTILSIIIGIIGALSLLFVTIGGFRYILSEGDPQAISKAKGTIVYALIGLIVAILAQAIVIFVMKGIT